MKYNSLIPELSVSDIEKSLEFYLMIGFEIKYKRDKFYFLSLDDNQIMIEEVNNNWNTGELVYPYGRGINISMTVKNISDIHCILKKNDYPIFKEIMINEYEVNGEIIYEHEFLVQDPDGYLLRFND